MSALPSRPPARGAMILRLAAFYALHAAAGLLFRSVSAAATIHALATGAVAVFLALSGRRTERVAWICAYVVGAEVLWRVTYADVPWEYAKYALGGTCLLALARRAERPRLGALGLYLLLLLPSALLTLGEVEPELARKILSFNLSGPIALALAVAFFSTLRFSLPQFLELLAVFLGPIVSLSAILLTGTLQLTEATFSGGSNFATSGGFGPNQVSALLGFGALGAIFLALEDRLGLPVRAGFMALALVLAGQSALTFSRGGLYAAGGALLAAAAFLVRDPKARIRLALVLCVVLATMAFVVFPFLDDLTGGALGARFADRGLTNRAEIAQSDLQIFFEHPVLGVGPGMSIHYREPDVVRAVAHTEFSRLLAEHGIFGLAALVLLCAAAAKRLLAQAPPARGVAAALLAWSFLFMAANGMRVAAPSFSYALAFAALPALGRAGGGGAR